MLYLIVLLICLPLLTGAFYLLFIHPCLVQRPQPCISDTRTNRAQAAWDRAESNELTLLTPTEERGYDRD